MITALCIGGPLDGQVITLQEARDVYTYPQPPGPPAVYDLRPWGRAHVQYHYRHEDRDR